MAIDYPVLLCAECDQPMLTIVDVVSRENGDPMNFVSYRCQCCGSSLSKLQDDGTMPNV